MLILGIETSCDETATALYELESDYSSGKLLAERISSQVAMHQEYGGVVPELASREHLRNLPHLVQDVLTAAGHASSAIDLIAVTAGPGLKGCLLMGLSFAQGLQLALGCKLTAINHIEAHQFSAFVDRPQDLKFPFLSVIVSGGHTEIVEVRALGDYHVLARTADDAAGEAFDKSAHLLGLDYPGGPRLAALADKFAAQILQAEDPATANRELGKQGKFKSQFVLPKVMREAEGFSFSGLKTAISLCVQRQKRLGDEVFEQSKSELAWVIQQSIVDAIVFKVQREVTRTGIKRVVLSGGVSANRELQKCLRSMLGVELFIPDTRHYTDNAAMIAFLAALKVSHVQGLESDLSVRPRWWLETMQAELS